MHSSPEVSWHSKAVFTPGGQNRALPKAITAELSSYRKSVVFTRCGKAPTGVEGQNKKGEKCDSQSNESEESEAHNMWFNNRNVNIRQDFGGI